jgi:microcystin-dependent protein
MFDDFCFDKGRCRMVGEIIPFAGAANPDPDRWLPCDGSLYAVADYPDLYAVIDVFYGGIPFVNFNVPDLRGRIPLGAGHGTGLTDRPLATTGGEETHTLIEAEIPSHTHTTGNSLLIATATPPPLDVLGPNPLPASTGSTGGDGPHENMPPWLAINYFIASKP